MPATLPMGKRANKSYNGAWSGFVYAAGTVILLLVLSLVPPVEVFGVKLPRVNPYPDVVEYDDSALPEDFDPLPVPEIIAEADTAVQVTFGDIDSCRTVRVAFLGDSFIEGDILTGNLREHLQADFGGEGVGFVPCQLPFRIYRKNVSVSGSGWTSYGILKAKKAPEKVRSRFLSSGYLSVGGAGAVMKWKQNYGCQHCVGRVFFLSPGDSRVRLKAGELAYTCEVGGSDRLRQVVARSCDGTLEFEVLSGEVIVYGASFESAHGVIVDNLSVRSNNGSAVFNASAQLNRQFAEMAGYDIVVLQYGLNIMQPDKKNYSKYQKQVEDMIACAGLIFPDSRIVVMGVSDRGILRDGETVYSSINSAEALTRHQKAAAQNKEALFWDTYAEMNALGGLPVFAERGWVASDQTHFTYAGGAVLATRMLPFMSALVLEAGRPVMEPLEAVDSIPRTKAELQHAHDSLAAIPQ